jgi:hypothetical protein
VQAPVTEEERSKKSIKQKINKEFWAALQKEGLFVLLLICKIKFLFSRASV